MVHVVVQDRRQVATVAEGGGPSALIGRSAELARLLDLAHATRDQGCRLATVVGEPGIGKSRLLRELAAAAAPETGVMWGSATEYESQVPFGAVRAAFDSFLPTVDPRCLATIDPGHLALLAEVVPSLRMVGGDRGLPRPAPAERFRLYRAVRALLEALCAARPMLLVVDDVHWADEGTVELCQHLLRHPPRGPLMITLAYRPRQVSHRLGATIQEGRTTDVELGPLPFDDATTMLGGGLDRPTRKRLYELSDGNPLYLETLSRHPGGLGADGQVRVDPAYPVQFALSREIAALDAVPLLVARAAAIVGDAFEPGVVAEVAQVTEEVVLETLDELVARDLVRPTGTGNWNRFRHPLVRSAAYQSAGAGWRLAGHARAADALRRLGARATDQAHHVERSCAPGDHQAIAILVAAAETALCTAPAVAAHWFRAALRLMPEGIPPERDGGVDAPDRLAVLDRLARALGLSGRLTESRQVMHELLALLPRSSERRAHAAAFCAMVERLLGHYAEANAMLRAELDDLAGEANPAAAIIKIGLALGQMLRGGLAAERDWAGEAAATALELGDHPLRAAALTIQALSVLMGVRMAGAAAGTRGSALEGLREAAGIIDSLPDPELVDHIDAFGLLGSAEFMTERLGEAERHLRRCLRITRAGGRIHLQTTVTLGLGVVYGRTGRLREALECFDDALDSALLTGSHEQLSMSQSCRAWIMAWMGDLAGAAEAADEAMVLAGSLPGYFSAATRCRVAYIRYYSGDPAGCVDLLVDGCGGPELAALDPLSRLTAFTILAAAQVQLGCEAEAIRWAEQARAAAADSPLASHAGLAGLALATALAERDPGTAVGHADAAVEAFGRVRDPISAGCAQLAAARALAVRGDVTAAQERHVRARELFGAGGAVLFLQLVEQAQRRLSAQQPRRRDSGISAEDAGLTRRELEIARLVAAGLTNRQIGERLYLSTRTVETHVGRVFAKLGVSNRSAVVHVVDLEPSSVATDI